MFNTLPTTYDAIKDWSWEQFKPYADDLLARDLTDASADAFLKDWTHLQEAIGEILNRARIGKHCIIGANSLITEGKDIPDRSLVMGSPGKVVRTVTDEEVEFLMWSAENYVQKTRRYRDTFAPQED